MQGVGSDCSHFPACLLGASASMAPTHCICFGKPCKSVWLCKEELKRVGMRGSGNREDGSQSLGLLAFMTGSASQLEG